MAEKCFINPSFVAVGQTRARFFLVLMRKRFPCLAIYQAIKIACPFQGVG